MFDSCYHFKDNSLNAIKIQSKLLDKYKVKKSLCMYDYEINNQEREIFSKNISKFKNLIHVPVLNRSDFKTSLKKKFKDYKFIKLNPRILNIRIENIKFYEKLFQKLSQTNLIILWCTFDSYENFPCKIDQLSFLSKIVTPLKKNKIILMHGGGTNILKYYEKFRFCENVYLDLSYTFDHFFNTNLINDVVFLLKKFDRRIILGSDYPTINYKVHINNINKIIKKYKIPKSKNNNFLFKNLNSLIYD